MPTNAEYEVEVYRQHVQAVEKYRYYILAIQGAAIAFAITQTSSTPLTVASIPIVAAMGCWAWGFVAGCKSILYTHGALYANAGLLRILQGKDELVGAHPQRIAIGAEVARDTANKDSKQAGDYGAMQFPALIWGALLFIVWHLLRMALLNPALAVWLHSVGM